MQLEQIRLSSLGNLTHTLRRLVEGRLWLKVLIGMVLGIGVGIVLGPTVGWFEPHVAGTLVSWLALPGTLFLTLVRMILVPLVFASLVRGLAASENAEQLKQLGFGGAVFFIVTSAIATGLGLTLALFVRPGTVIDPELVRTAVGPRATLATTVGDQDMSLSDLPDLLTSLLPSNPLASMINAEMLQIVLFAIIIGVALVNISPAKSRPLFDLLGSLQEVSMKVVSWAMRLAPLAVFGLVARLVSAVGVDVLAGMGVYVLTVIAGLTILILMYSVIVATLGGRNPLTFFAAAREVTLLAFSTSSSAAVMPLSIKTAEDKLEVRPSIAGFLIPLGATLNMNGTALYQGVATVFLAQVFEVALSPMGLLFVVVTAVAASIGSPSAPGAGIVILAMVLEGVGIPVAGIALILGVDRILDMCRTAINVLGDLTACVVLDRWAKKEQPTTAAATQTG